MWKKGIHKIVWTREQLEQRRNQMEELHPGYLDINLKLKIALSAVLILRLLYFGLLTVLGQGYSPIYGAINLMICFSLYSTILQSSWKISWLFLVIRIIEFVRTIPVFATIIYLNFFGVLLYVVLGIALLTDIIFLASIAFRKKIQEVVRRNQLVNSDQRLTLHIYPEEFCALTEESDQEPKDV